MIKITEFFNTLEMFEGVGWVLKGNFEFEANEHLCRGIKSVSWEYS